VLRAAPGLVPPFLPLLLVLGGSSRPGDRVAMGVSSPTRFSRVERDLERVRTRRLKVPSVRGEVRGGDSLLGEYDMSRCRDETLGEKQAQGLGGASQSRLGQGGGSEEEAGSRAALSCILARGAQELYGLVFELETVEPLSRCSLSKRAESNLSSRELLA